MSKACCLWGLVPTGTLWGWAWEPHPRSSWSLGLKGAACGEVGGKGLSGPSLWPEAFDPHPDVVSVGCGACVVLAPCIPMPPACGPGRFPGGVWGSQHPWPGEGLGLWPAVGGHETWWVRSWLGKRTVGLVLAYPSGDVFCSWPRLGLGKPGSTVHSLRTCWGCLALWHSCEAFPYFWLWAPGSLLCFLYGLGLQGPLPISSSGSCLLWALRRGHTVQWMMWVHMCLGRRPTR